MSARVVVAAAFWGLVPWLVFFRGFFRYGAVTLTDDVVAVTWASPGPGQSVGWGDCGAFELRRFWGICWVEVQSSGGTVLLPATLRGLSPAALVALLNEHRDRALASGLALPTSDGGTSRDR